MDFDAGWKEATKQRARNEEIAEGIKARQGEKMANAIVTLGALRVYLELMIPPKMAVGEGIFGLMQTFRKQAEDQASGLFLAAAGDDFTLERMDEIAEEVNLFSRAFTESIASTVSKVR